LATIIKSFRHRAFANQNQVNFFLSQESHPCVLQNFHQFEAAAAGKLVAIFLDYDGTLAPIVNNPDAAHMSEHMREAVRRVARLFPTAIISGRGREKVEQFVQLKELFYAGSHGMDIAGPKIKIDGQIIEEDGATFQPAAQYEPLMMMLAEKLWNAVNTIPGSTVENNKFCVSVHFRNCAPEDYDRVTAAVDQIMSQHQELHVTRGRKVLEVRPKMDWNKGSALLHLVKMLGLQEKDVFCVYIGDDRTDEDAFQVLAETGTGSGILVSTKCKSTAGKWTLRDPAEVASFLYRLVGWGHTSANKWHETSKCNGWHLIAETTPQGKNAAVMAAFGGNDGGNGGGGGGILGSAAGRLGSPHELPPIPPPRPNGK
jgi:trehalose 6-phosphate phosphatase